MSENKECCDVSKKCCGGSSVKIFLVLLVGAAVIALAYMSGKITGVEKEGDAAQSTAEVEAEADPAQVLATVDGVAITRGEAMELLAQMPAQMRQLPPEQLLPMAVEQVINNKVISKKSSASGLDRDPEVLKQLAMAKEQIVRAKFVELEVEKKVKEEDVKKEYEQYVLNFPKVEEVKANHILVEDEAKAKELIKQLDAGKDFAELAKENSTDGTAQNGGDLGYFGKDEVVPEFGEAAFALEPGTYSKTPVKSEFGYHVIKSEDKRVRPAAEYDQVKPYIEQEIKRTALEALIGDWRSESKIERFDADGNLIPSHADENASANAAGEAAPQEAPVAAEEAAPAPEAAPEAPVEEAAPAAEEKAAE